MPGHPGVVEDEQPDGAGAGGGVCDVAGQLGRRDAGQAAVGVIQQGDTGRPEFGSRPAQFGFAHAVQIGVHLVQGGCPAVGEAQDVHGSTGRRELVDDRAQAEALIIGVRDHHQHAWPGGQHRPGLTGA